MKLAGKIFATRKADTITLMSSSNPPVMIIFFVLNRIKINSHFLMIDGTFFVAFAPTRKHLNTREERVDL